MGRTSEEREMLAEMATPTGESTRQEVLERKLYIATMSTEDRSVQIAAIKAELAVYEAADAAEFAGEWTKDVTIARRAAWNVEANRIARLPKAAQRAAANAMPATAGHTIEDLKAAVKLHNL